MNNKETITPPNLSNETVSKQHTCTAIEIEGTKMQYLQEQLKTLRASVSKLEDEITDKDIYIEKIK